jgi:NADPH:quinone reductase-like Zn-dependent oxidoreductase
MKAIVIEKFGSPEVFQLREIPEPVINHRELLIEVVAGSVNPIDCKQRKGNHRFLFGAPFPVVLGYDVSGIVAKVGTDVKRFKVGDRVCGVLKNKYGGGLGQFAKGDESCFSPVPETINLSVCAALPMAGLTALQALRDKGKITKDMKVLIIGAAGGVGHFAHQVASLFQARVFSVSSAAHQAFLDQLAPYNFIDYKSTDLLAINKTFDIIFDTVGNYSFPVISHLLAPGGIYINILPRPKIIFHKILALFTRGKKVRTLLMKHTPADLEQLITWVSEGKIKICIDKEFHVHQVAKAHEYSEAGHTEGKILIHYHW